MIDKHTIRWFLRGVMGMGLLLVAVGGMSHPHPGRAWDGQAGISSADGSLGGGEIESQDYTSPMVVPAAAFATDGLPSRGWRFNVNGYLYGSPSCDLIAPVYLPDGTTIVSVSATVKDSSDKRVRILLRRVNAYSSPETTDDMADFSSSGSGFQASLEAPAIENPVIDQTKYSYWLRVQLPDSNTQLYAVRVYYQ
jgi:hypothetical protein